MMALAKTRTGALALFGALACGAAGFEWYTQNRVLPGVVAAGLNLGGLTQDEAKTKLEASNATPPTLKLQAGQTSATLPSSEIGWRVNTAQSAAAAFAFGRNGDLGARLVARWQAITGQVQLPVVANVDQNALQEKLEAFVAPLRQTPKDASVQRNGPKFVVVTDTNGLDYGLAKAQETFLKNPNASTLTLEPVAVPAALQRKQLEGAVREANSLARGINLRYQNPNDTSKTIGSLALSPNETAALLRVDANGVALSSPAMSALLDRVSRFDIPAKAARYVRDGTGALKPKPGQDGMRLQRPASGEILKRDILNPNIDTIELPSSMQASGVTTATLPKENELKLLSEATTYFAGSSLERSTNVMVAASKLDGYVVAPGTDFNFLEALGTIGVETGFAEGLIISQGRTIKGVGGGVCQSSTTTFRALYKAGLPILERTHHAYRVHWYDPYVGFDAAVFDPSVNLRMKNDTGGALLLRASANRSSINVKLYGVPDGRTVVVSQPYILSRTPHPRTRYEIDYRKPRGYIEQIDWAADGYRTRLVRGITDAKGKTRREYLDSNYRPWQAVYRIGPGTNLLARR